MAKRSKNPKTSSFNKVLLVILLVIILGFFLYIKTVETLSQSPYFKVRLIVLDPSLQFLNKKDLTYLIGKNIFALDLNEVQRRLNNKYPQIAQLKFVKNYPDRIVVQAKRRFPFAQARIKNRVVILDQEGTIIFIVTTPDVKLPVISGLNVKNAQIEIGAPLSGKEVQLALKVIRAFRDNPVLSSMPVWEINAGNPSLIYFTTLNNIKIIIDKNEIERKMNILGIMLAQAKLDLAEVKYLDLRFREPIIGQK